MRDHVKPAFKVGQLVFIIREGKIVEVLVAGVETSQQMQQCAHYLDVDTEVYCSVTYLVQEPSLKPAETPYRHRLGASQVYGSVDDVIKRLKASIKE
jgi:hypothetical protein